MPRAGIEIDLQADHFVARGTPAPERRHDLRVHRVRPVERLDAHDHPDLGVGDFRQSRALGDEANRLAAHLALQEIETACLSKHRLRLHAGPEKEGIVIGRVGRRRQGRGGPDDQQRGQQGAHAVYQ
jgi:hypothetical protein